MAGIADKLGQRIRGQARSPNSSTHPSKALQGVSPGDAEHLETAFNRAHVDAVLLLLADAQLLKFSVPCD